MTTGIVRDQNLERQIHKQMGCMAGFLQIFDRHQILTGKRIYSHKRLPPASDSTPEPDKHGASPETKSSLPVLEFREGTRSPWKFSRDSPRLSLDSRAIVDAKGSLHPREIPTSTNAHSKPQNDTEKQRRSTSSGNSVIAKLMGLDPLPDSDPIKLRRSASESRVSRDLSLPLPHPHPHPHPRFFNHNHNHSSTNDINIINNNTISSMHRMHMDMDMDIRLSSPNPNPKALDPSEPARTASLPLRLKKSFYDSADFFPEPKHSVSVYGEIERRLRMRGINEPSKDLHTLKHILEALQLKGLLHSSNKPNQSPIVVMKPARFGFDSPPPHSALRSSPRARRGPIPEPEAPRRSPMSSHITTPNQGRGKSTSPNRRNAEPPQRKVAARVVNSSAKTNNGSRRNVNGNGTVQNVTGGGSPRMRKMNEQQQQQQQQQQQRKEKVVLSVAEDESSTVSDNSFSTSSHPDTERYKFEEYNREGRDLLDRCDKLLSSIAEITAASELQPSPVSVLDSSFYRDEWCAPSPITKRCIDYKDQAAESEDDVWMCGSEGKSEEAASEDNDYVYVTEILRACSYMPEESDVFVVLEKQQGLKGKDTSKASKLQRRLVFDTLQEILSRNQHMPPWKAASCGGERQRVWSEFRRIREREESEQSEDLFKVICGVLKKDMAEEVTGWGEWTVEMGDMVLDIERLVFKDLVGETIRELASFFPPQCNNHDNNLSALRRRLVF